MESINIMAENQIVRFGVIKLGARFVYNSKIWERLHGKFAIPINDIGQGQSGWPFEVNTLVEKIKISN